MTLVRLSDLAEREREREREREIVSYSIFISLVYLVLEKFSPPERFEPPILEWKLETLPLGREEG